MSAHWFHLIDIGLSLNITEKYPLALITTLLKIALLT